MKQKPFIIVPSVLMGLMLTLPMAPAAFGDGKLVPPRDYAGSLEEQAQEAIIIFLGGSANASAKQQLILKIRVEGDVDHFAWVVPLPAEPKTEKADAKLFEELFRYVQAQQARRTPPSKKGLKDAAAGDAASADQKVEVISREVVGAYQVDVVREKQAGALNTWLTDNKYQALENSDDIIGFYRDKGYVFACVRVSDAARGENDTGKTIDLHPLSFTFETGGRDGIFFPMRMTGLQEDAFDVNLYVFYRFWLNDRINEFGYTHRGFDLVHRDWDTRQCVANGGKSWATPEKNPMLRHVAHHIPTVKAFFAENYAEETFYLTNLAARRLDPKQVRQWKDDLWLFPYYTNPKVVPHDVQNDGPASGAWEGRFSNYTGPSPGDARAYERDGGDAAVLTAVLIGAVALALLALIVVQRRLRKG